MREIRRLLTPRSCRRRSNDNGSLDLFFGTTDPIGSPGWIANGSKFIEQYITTLCAIFLLSFRLGVVARSALSRSAPYRWLIIGIVTSELVPLNRMLSHYCCIQRQCCFVLVVVSKAGEGHHTWVKHQTLHSPRPPLCCVCQSP